MKAALVIVVALTLAGTAAAAWEPSGPGSSAARAKTLPASTDAPQQPTAAGQSVTVTWSAATFVEGGAVPGYVVRRYNGMTSVEDTSVQAACSGVVLALSCTETNVPIGSWKYTVTPALGANWRSLTPSPFSPSVTVLL